MKHGTLPLLVSLATTTIAAPAGSQVATALLREGDPFPAAGPATSWPASTTSP